MRSEEPLEEATERGGGPDPGREAERSALREDLLGALAVLDETRREVTLLHDVEGWRHAEIAERLGMPEGTVRYHLHEARRTLRERLRWALRRGDPRMSDDLEPGWAPLDPSRDPERWESMVRGILERAAPILAGYAARGPADWLASWSRPALAAAAVVSALARERWSRRSRARYRRRARRSVWAMRSATPVPPRVSTGQTRRSSRTRHGGEKPMTIESQRSIWIAAAVLALVFLAGGLAGAAIALFSHRHRSPHDMVMERIHLPEVPPAPGAPGVRCSTSGWGTSSAPSSVSTTSRPRASTA